MVRFAARRIPHRLVPEETILTALTRALDERRWAVLCGSPGSGKSWLAELIRLAYPESQRVSVESSTCSQCLLQSSMGAGSSPTDTLLVVDDLDAPKLEEMMSLGRPLLEADPRLRLLFVASQANLPSRYDIERFELSYLGAEESRRALATLAPEAPQRTIARLADELMGFPPWIADAAELLRANPWMSLAGVRAELFRKAHPSALRAISRLDPGDQRLLRSLSVPAKWSFDGGDAAALLEVPVGTLTPALDRLEHAGALIRDANRYRVPPPLRHAAGSQLDRKERDALTERSDRLRVEAMEANRWALSSPDAATLLSVAERTSDSELRARALAAIPPWSLRDSDAALLGQLAASEAGIPETLRAELCMLRGELASARERYARLSASRQVLHAAEATLRQAYVLRREGALHDAEDCLARLLPMASLPPPLEARALCELAAGLYLRGQVERSAATLQRAHRLAVDVRDTALRGAICTNLANARADLGDAAGARRAAEEAFGWARDDRGRSIALANLGRVLLDQGALADAESVLRDVSRSTLCSAEAGFRGFVMRLRGWRAALGGDVPAASAAFEEATQIADKMGEMHAAAIAVLEHAIVSLEERPDNAIKLLVRAVSRLDASSGFRRLADLLLVALRKAPPPQLTWARDATGLPGRSAQLISLVWDGEPLSSAIPALRVARDAAWTRVLSSYVESRAPDRLSFVALDHRCEEALVGTRRVDLRGKRGSANVLAALFEHPEGLDGRGLLDAGWPGETLAFRRAKHRVHDAVRRLRALGVPIACRGGIYRLATTQHLRYGSVSQPTAKAS